MEKYLKGNIKNKNDYSDTSGKAYVYSIRIWDGVFISANCIYKEEIIHKGSSEYDMIFINCCLEGRCEVHFPDDSYGYVEKGMLSIDTKLPKEGYFYPGKKYEGFEFVIIPELAAGCPLHDFGLGEKLLDGFVQNGKGFLGTMSDPMISLCEKLYKIIPDERTTIEELRILTLEFLTMIKYGGTQKHISKRYVTKGQRHIANATEKIITADLSEHINISSIAMSLGIAESTVKKYFEAVYGISISGYLRNRRMALAEKLLSGSAESVGNIAGRCGYINQAKFGAVFKAHTGSTPLEYRRLNKIIKKEGDTDQ